MALTLLAALLTWRIHKDAGFPPVCWEHGLAPSNLDGAMPEENSQADDTRKLRARFPRWGILFDPLESVWVAVRGKKTLVAASTPQTLTERVEAAARGEAGPYEEGEKTQAWRARRTHRSHLPKTPAAPLPATGDVGAGPAAASGRP